MRHVTQYGSCFARFGKHSMLLFIHACMHVSFTHPPALRARQYGSRCCATLPPLTLFALEDNQSSGSARKRSARTHQTRRTDVHGNYVPPARVVTCFQTSVVSTSFSRNENR